MTAPIPHAEFDPLAGHGWTPERKTAFLDHLAHKGNVRAACKRVGLSREAAYCLRRRDPLFARGWAAGLVQAREASVEVLADRAIEGVEEPVYYRGELVGTRRKYDTRLLLAHLARLDKLVEDNRAAVADAGRFDELLACIAEEGIPAPLVNEDDALPLTREYAATAVAIAAGEAVETEAEPGDDEAEERAVEAYRRGRIEGAALWDGWFEDACGYVDWACGRDEEGPQFSPRTVSRVST
jgi:hypothetical protein